MITFLQIKYFLEINKTKNISQAAKQLLIAQQTLSRSLDSIEKELGVQLFERGTPLMLTDCGRIFLHYAEDMIDKQTALSNALSDVTGNISGTIRCGISYNRSPVLLPKAISDFQVRYPGIDIFVFEGNQLEIEQALLSRDIDLAIEHIPFHSRDLVEEKILEDQLYLLIPESLVAQRYGANVPEIMKQVRQGSISPLMQLPFLLNKNGNTIRAAMKRIFDLEQIQPAISTETENMETLFELCLIGRGITVYPGSFLSEDVRKRCKERVHIVRLPYEQARYTLGVVYRKEYYLTSAGREFIRLLKHHANETLAQCRKETERVVQP